MSDLPPVGQCLGDLKAALTRYPVVVLSAPTGSGKTTFVPPALLDLTFLESRKILMLEPRRLAARLACEWMAARRGERVGATIGYRTGYETVVSRATRIEVVTEGILTRRLQRDPGLDEVGLVIFDEVHERHLATDLGLALVRDVQASLRPDLRVLLMSATLAMDTFAQHFPDAPLIESEGRQFPVTIEYLPRTSDVRLDRLVRDGVLRVIGLTRGDVLVFLPGMREIALCERALLGDASSLGFALHRLHGTMTAAEQDLVREHAGRRRVILASAVAQSSVTLPRVDGVVDAGLMRAASFDRTSGLTRLLTSPASQDLADQRAGRAGRVRAGHCLRLWTEGDHRGRPRYAKPEIEQSDLSGLALDLAAWGTPDATALKWLTKPPPAALAAALTLLRDLGLVDARGSVTPAGRRTVESGFTPRAGAILAQADPALHPLVCALTVVLEERDLARDRDDASVTTRLALLQQHPRSAAGLRLRRLARRIGVAPWDGTGATAEVLASLLIPGYRDRVALRVEGGEAPVFKLACGPRARLPLTDPLSRGEALVALVVEETADGPWIRLAAPIPGPVWARLQEMAVEHLHTRWDERAQAFAAHRERALGAIALKTIPAPLPVDADFASILEAAVRRAGLAVLPWDEEARKLRARLQWLGSSRPGDGWPDVGDTALGANPGRWLDAAIVPAGPRGVAVDVGRGLRYGLLTPGQWVELERLAPETLTLRSGRRYALRYSDDRGPVLAAPLQEFFGMTEAPLLAGGRLRVTLELLSPARRPLQVTSDLRGFWQSGYLELRRSLAARYPRHDWPLDPLSPAPLKSRGRRS